MPETVRHRPLAVLAVVFALSGSPALGQSTSPLPRRGNLPLEQQPGIETVYTEVTNPNGLRQRAILTRPAGTTRRLPAVLFVPWLSCDSVESPQGPSPGIDQVLRMIPEWGVVMLRGRSR